MASEYIKYQCRDVEPERPLVLTPEQKRKNWWHYHKWHIALGIVLLIVAADLVRLAFGWGVSQPDILVAYAGSVPMPEETKAALEDAFSSLATEAAGEPVSVALQVYLFSPEGDDTGMYSLASSTKLMADLEGCDSFLFLLEDAETFQANYQILCHPDGTLPGFAEVDASACYLNWDACPGLTAFEDISDTTGMDLSRLFVARRGFWSEKSTKHPEWCLALWEAIAGDAANPK